MNKLFEFDKVQKSGTVGALNICLGEHDFLLGTDEAGRGPVAGGVFASCVCFYDDIDFSLFEKLNDSKKISEETRNELFEIIKNNAFYSINCVEIEEIEKINILQSSLLAMKQSVLDVLNQMNAEFNQVLLLIDGNQKIRFNVPQKTIIKGDSTSASIAAASILAKVERDRYMAKLDEKYPQYDFANNKGYLTKEHLSAIKKCGLCPCHRLSFLKNIVGQ